MRTNNNLVSIIYKDQTQYIETENLIPQFRK